MTGTVDAPAMLQVNGVSKAFGGNPVLKDVCFALTAGEALAIVGENGAGKSTLMNILAGTLGADAGLIRFDGQPFRPAGPRAVAALGIAVAFQETALAPDLTVAENLLFAREPRRFGLIRPGALRRQAEALLASLGFTLDVGRLCRTLSAAERHIAEIAKAVGQDPRLLILDEPTAALSSHDAGLVLTAVKRITARGGAVIFISHRLDEVIEAADRVVVLKDGVLTLDARRGEFDRDGLIRAMVGRTLSDIFPPRPSRVASTTPRLAVTDGTAPGLDRLSFAVQPGEIVGFSGLEGQGQRPLAGALCGMAPFRSGLVALDGVPIAIRSVAAAIRAGIATIPEDRKIEGLALDLPVRVNVSLFALTRITQWGWLPAQQDRAYAEAARKRFGMRIAGLEQPVRQLSGGNQQKVVFARWMADTPKVLVLHEPTKGIDIGTKAEIYRLVGELTRQGVAVVLISSDMLELIGLCDRIHVLRAGAIAGSLERDGFGEEALMGLAAGPDGADGLRDAA